MLSIPGPMRQRRDPGLSPRFAFTSRPVLSPQAMTAVISDPSQQTNPTVTLHVTAHSACDDPVPTNFPGLFPECSALILLPGTTNLSHLELLAGVFSPPGHSLLSAPEESIFLEDQCEPFVKSLFFALGTLGVT